MLALLGELGYSADMVSFIVNQSKLKGAAMDNCKVVKITTGKIEFIGTEKECRKYKRAHYDRFTYIYRPDGSIAHG